LRRKRTFGNDCPKKEIKTNRVAKDSYSDEEEEDEETDSGDEQFSTEEVFVGMILHSSNTTTTTENSAIPFQALEANINSNGHQARVLFDIGTIETDLLSNQFITTHNIPVESLKKPRTLKIAVKGSRSSANHKCNVTFEIGKHQFIPAPIMNSIYFPKVKLRIICTPKSAQLRSAMTHNEVNFDAISRFPTVFVESIPDTLHPLRQVNHRIRLKDPNLTINMP
jgi:hypothetical protein